jgi:serine/threonine protein kinase
VTGPLTMEQQLHIKYLHHIRPIVDGLFHDLLSQYQAKILHRDLRLSNIVLNRGSRVTTLLDVEIIDYELIQ